jgi:hypothetical protein
MVALNPEDANATTVVEGTISLYDIEATVLVDPGSTHFFIASPFTCVLNLDNKAIPCNVVVSSPFGKQLGSDLSYGDCEMKLGNVTLVGDLIHLPIEDYDIILGMDWLSRHYGLVDCKQKVVYFYKPRKDVLEFRGEKVKAESCLISRARAQKLLYKSCTGYLAYLLNKPLELGKIEEVPVVNENSDVFPTELTKVPPNKKVEYAIDLMPMTEPVSRTPYRMAPAELTELKEQLQELLT